MPRKPKTPPMPGPNLLRRKAVEKLSEDLGIEKDLAGYVHTNVLSAEKAIFLHVYRDYMKAHYDESHLEEAMEKSSRLKFGFHGSTLVEGTITAMTPYTFSYADPSGNVTEIKKLALKFFYPIELDEKVQKLLKVEEAVKKLNLGMIEKPVERNHIKNKVLLPLMQKREVLFFTTLEGDVIRGIVEGFNRYEICVHMKGGTPIMLLRHAIYDIRDKEGKVSFLKNKNE